MRSASTIVASAWLALIAATATPIPTCNQENAGVVACVAGKLCQCGGVQASRATWQADGFQWDCGILRPDCWDAQPDPTLQGWEGDLPITVDIEADRRRLGYRPDRPDRPRPKPPISLPRAD